MFISYTLYVYVNKLCVLLHKIRQVKLFYVFKSARAKQ